MLIKHIHTRFRGTTTWSSVLALHFVERHGYFVYLIPSQSLYFENLSFVFYIWLAEKYLMMLIFVLFLFLFEIKLILNLRLVAWDITIEFKRLIGLFVQMFRCSDAVSDTK